MAVSTVKAQSLQYPPFTWYLGQNNTWTGYQLFDSIGINKSLSLYNLNGNRWFYANGSDSSLTINGITLSLANILDPADFSGGRMIQEYNGAFVPVWLDTVLNEASRTWLKPQIYDSTITTASYKQKSVVTIADSVINCNLSNTFQKTLSATQRFVISNIGDGQTLNIAVTNTASNYTVTWVDPDGLTIKWADSIVPVQTIGDKTDVWTFVRIGTVIYGNVIQNF